MAQTVGQSVQVVEAARPMSAEERKVIFASSLGTVFEWYDFYLYGSLSVIIARHFFSGVNETTSYIFALLAFAAGFFVRPFGALVFGRVGDLVDVREAGKRRLLEGGREEIQMTVPSVNRFPSRPPDRCRA